MYASLFTNVFNLIFRAVYYIPNLHFTIEQIGLDCNNYFVLIQTNANYFSLFIHISSLKISVHDCTISPRLLQRTNSLYFAIQLLIINNDENSLLCCIVLFILGDQSNNLDVENLIDDFVLFYSAGNLVLTIILSRL